MRNHMAANLPENLRHACSFEKSVSHVCRSVGINRQQFSKYLAGTATPSSYNMHRICDYFGIRPIDFMLQPEEFAQRLGATGKRELAATGLELETTPLLQAFPGNRRALSRYLGDYLTYCHSFSWNGYVLKAFTRLYERDGLIFSKTIERARDPEDGELYLSKYNGMVSLLGNRIFIMEHQSLANDALVETVLHPTTRSELGLMRGVTFGVSSKQRRPYISRSVWKFMGTNADVRSAIEAIGLFPVNSIQVDPKIMRILGRDPLPNHLLHYDVDPNR